MKITTFNVIDQRNVKVASSATVPAIMIITGPNGCGKSTLLQALRAAQSGRRPMYIGPHRASRRQKVRMRHMGPEIDMRAVLEGQKLPGYEGIERSSNERTPWDHDEASNFIKYGLCQIEFERTAVIAKIYDKEKVIAQGSVPDVWKPMREMTENLLPHLRFEGIDTSNRESYQCLWRVHDGPALVDIDDLSSGEKSIIQLFYPVVEHSIKEMLSTLQGRTTADRAEGLCVLVDEPELHLHPNLQGKVLDYMRTLSVREGAQFILATHSPTIVENATSDELYLLRPSELVPVGQNQLTRIATDEEKLRLLRDVFGSTSNLTALRPVLVVEGRRDNASSVTAADSRVYSFLSGEFNRITIVSGGGKSECARLVTGLNGYLKSFSQELRAHALLDRDLDEIDPTEENIHLLPVSMVENLLIDPTVVWDATRTVHHRMQLTSAKEVETALDTILGAMEPSEAVRRLKAKVGPQIFRLSDPVEGAETQLEQFVTKLRDEMSKEKLSALQAASTSSVQKIRTENRRREFFDGKKILNEFYKTHMHDTGMSKEIFIYQCAQEASARRSVKAFTQKLMSALGLQSEESSNSPAASPPEDEAVVLFDAGLSGGG